MGTYQNYAKLRDKAGLSDYRISKMSGVSTSTFSDWRNGKHQPNKSNLAKIAGAMNVPVDAFFTNGEIKNEKNVFPDLTELVPERITYTIKLDDGSIVQLEEKEYREFRVAVHAYQQYWLASKKNNKPENN